MHINVWNHPLSINANKMFTFWALLKRVFVLNVKEAHRHLWMYIHFLVYFPNLKSKNNIRWVYNVQQVDGAWPIQWPYEAGRNKARGLDITCTTLVTYSVHIIFTCPDYVSMTTNDVILCCFLLEEKKVQCDEESRNTQFNYMFTAHMHVVMIGSSFWCFYF